MADTLEIFGVEYTGVTGIIATNDQSTDLTYIRPQGTKSISANGTGIDVAEYASVNVSVPSEQPTLQTKSVSYTPTESAQTESVTADSGYDGLSQVNVSVGAVSSTYVGSGITRRSSTDLTASGATVTVPSGYYSAQASKAVASGTAGTPTATKGTVSNNSVSITPSVTNVTGYITGGTQTGTAITVSASELVSGTLYCDDDGSWNVTNAETFVVDAGTVNNPTATKGTVTNHSVTVTPSVSHTGGWISSGTKTGTAVTVSASELVSGTYSVTSSGTKDVTNYASASVPAGTAGTPTATKGTVSNHSVSVTPSVTNTAGYISGGTHTGTTVTVSASELVSGSETKTENGTYDVTNLASLVVNVPSGSGGLVYETGTLTLSSDANAPIISFANAHDDIPIYINIADVTETLATSNSNLYWTFMNWYTLNDSFIKTTSSSNMYGRYQYGWKTSSGASAGNIDCTNTGTGSGSLYYLVTEDRFGPYCGSTNRYWRAGRTYKWIAVWAPTA